MFFVKGDKVITPSKHKAVVTHSPNSQSRLTPITLNVNIDGMKVKLIYLSQDLKHV